MVDPKNDDFGSAPGIGIDPVAPEGYMLGLFEVGIEMPIGLAVLPPMSFMLLPEEVIAKLKKH